jgi:biopolymer transport protein ExbD
MQIARYPRSRRLGINMTPMMDVVFLLIIFFLVSNHLVRQESRIKVELPQAASGEPESIDPRARLTLTVTDDGTLFVGGQPIQPNQVESRLAVLVAAEGNEVEVRIRASRDLPYRTIEPLMVACAKQGVWNLTFAVYEAERP